MTKQTKLAPMQKPEEFHSYVSPSNTKCAKCPAAGFREDFVNRRNRFIMDYATHFMGVGDREQVLAEFSDRTEQNSSGTAAHAWLEKKLTGQDPGMAPEEYAYMLEKIAEEIMEDLEQASEVYIEERWANVGLDSGGSADVVYRMDHMIVVRDLKNGRVPVRAENNWQMMRYAGGVMDRLGWPEEVTHIRMVIDATRFEQSEWVITTGALKEFAFNTLRGQMLAANSLNPKAVPGTHCKYCDASPYCKEGWENAERVLLEAQAFDGEFGNMELGQLEEQAAKIHAIVSSSAMLDKIKAEIKRIAVLNNTMFGDTGLKKCDLRPGRTMKNWAVPVSGKMLAEKFGSKVSAKPMVLTPGGKVKSKKQLIAAFPEQSDTIEQHYAQMVADPDATLQHFNTVLAGRPNLFEEVKPKKPSDVAKLIGNVPELQQMVTEKTTAPSLFI